MRPDRYLPALDGWRAVAIAMVVISHAFTIESARTGGALNLLLFRLGTFGVMLFFAISGFLICTRLLEELETAGRISLGSFYVRRAFRILPAAYTYLAVIGALAAAGILTVSSRDLTAAAFFYGNYAVADSWFTGHFWTLALEEHFYLFWPPLLAMLGRWPALWAAAGLTALSVVLRYRAGGGELPGYTHLRLDAFLIPCILAIALSHRPWRNWFQRVMTPAAWWGLVLVLVAAVVAGAAVSVLKEPQRLCQSLILPILVAATVLQPIGWVSRLLAHPALEWIGRASYSIYLWQQLVFGFAPSAWPKRMLALPFLLALILGLAAFSRRWIEEPMIAWGRRLARRFPTAP